MEVTVNEKGSIQLEEVFNGVTLKTPDGEIVDLSLTIKENCISQNKGL